MVKKVNHIGIAVHSIETVIPFYTDVLHLSFISFEEVPTQQVKVAFLSAGDTKIELLEPMSDESAIAKFLKKKGEGIHHIGFEVDHLAAELSELKEQGVPLIDDIPRIGAANAKIAFLHPNAANHVLIELCEKQRGDL
jgi:methylmalonyl-CoA/ethylmalonyl-CoA epimerase